MQLTSLFTLLLVAVLVSVVLAYPTAITRDFKHHNPRHVKTVTTTSTASITAATTPTSENAPSQEEINKLYVDGVEDDVQYYRPHQKRRCGNPGSCYVSILIVSKQKGVILIRGIVLTRVWNEAE
ncbi:hypothetical protein K469DRAFT_807992 [Zopfia rhizophila CBS 207.26]|uniref:Uncharacterized protein n=1 Tax=Zopfia rhizophila CBS 207.26 TaxID=1314779 RepID=A0A6A6EGY7_9PEZI|nr:hypothetical protein K469DRAFT_807992 [Zopfia rhizophila CBS 207.26]